ncbi:MAG: radical SAM protein [Desulfuromonadaceae bacterium]
MNHDILHPCFNGDGCHRVSRIHLPVAPLCNLKCHYCEQTLHCVGEDMPGKTRWVLKPEQAIQQVFAKQQLDPPLGVVGIAGPGDALYNPETFTTIDLVRKNFPQLNICLSSNGVLLPDEASRLQALGLTHLSVTVNTTDPIQGRAIYGWVQHAGDRYFGSEAAELIITKQLEGIAKAAALGIRIKVNMVLIPGVNDQQAQAVARAVKERDACLMNIIPLIPKGGFRKWSPPLAEDLYRIRRSCEPIIAQMYHCRQCRADACGPLTLKVSHS